MHSWILYVLHLYQQDLSHSYYLQFSAAFALERISIGMARPSDDPTFKSISAQISKVFKKKERICAIPLPKLHMVTQLLVKQNLHLIEFLCILIYMVSCLCALRAGEIFMLQKEFIDFDTGLLTWPSADMAAGVKAGRIRVLMQPALKLLQIYFSFAPLPAIRIPRQLIQAYLIAKLGVTLASARHVGAHFAIPPTTQTI